MIKVILSGALGRMGQMVEQTIDEVPDMEIVAAADPLADGAARSYPLYDHIGACDAEADVIIDFSHHSAVGEVLRFAVEKKLPAVIATTGLTDEELILVKEAGQSVAVLQTGNTSLGITLLSELVARAASFLGDDYDVEIVETHHNQKVDAPSGTALMLANAVNDGAFDGQKAFTFGRHGRSTKREKKEIGIHAVRGGTVVGEHQVRFFGPDEVIEIRHSAGSRRLFANGAVRAAKFLVGQPAGVYATKDLL
ncbi:MAG: 4-hydroxy-tetrahydrodipicolinate reductase [Christensenellales bacterium]|jgi:4-hydroxy-tetrahydrodipicolinate reductase